MIDLTESSQMRTNAGSPKTEKPNIIPKGQKPMLDEQGHLECEIKEIQLEIEQKAKAIGNLKGILERKEQQLREMQPQTLYRTLLQKTQMARPGCEQVCNIVRGWLIDHTVIETEDEEMITFTIHKEQLQTPK
jgi:hypothetical protein